MRNTKRNIVINSAVSFTRHPKMVSYPGCTKHGSRSLNYSVVELADADARIIERNRWEDNEAPSRKSEGRMKKFDRDGAAFHVKLEGPFRKLSRIVNCLGKIDRGELRANERRRFLEGRVAHRTFRNFGDSRSTERALNSRILSHDSVDRAGEFRARRS